MKTLGLLLFLSFSTFAAESGVDTMSESNTVDLSSEIIQLNEEAARTIASDNDSESTQKADIDFWFIEK